MIVSNINFYDIIVNSVDILTIYTCRYSNIECRMKLKNKPSYILKTEIKKYSNIIDLNIHCVRLIVNPVY